MAEDTDPAVCACGFWARDNCLYAKWVNVCDWPSSYPPAKRAIVYTYSTGPRKKREAAD